MDTKSWSKLESLFAPRISVDYSSVGGAQLSSVSPSSFIKTISSPEQLGNVEIITQHLIGACKWSELSETSLQAKFQIRAAHWRKDGGKAINNANAHGVNTFEFELTEEGWKIASITVVARHVEGDFMGIFKSKV